MQPNNSQGSSGSLCSQRTAKVVLAVLQPEQPFLSLVMLAQSQLCSCGEGAAIYKLLNVIAFSPSTCVAVREGIQFDTNSKFI